MTGNEAIGELFNPWKRFNGIMIPDPVLESDLSLGAKVCYGVLSRFAGENGKCFPTMQTIGRRIGVSDRQAKTYVAELAREKYIVRARGGSGRPNRYGFIWHSSFASADRKDSSRLRGRILHTEESHSRENTDLDYLATNRMSRDSQPDPSADALASLVAEQLGRVPSRSGLWRIISATPHRSAIEAMKAITAAVQRGYGADGEDGPHSVRWFESVVRNFCDDQTRYALPPTAAVAVFDAGELGSHLDVGEAAREPENG